MSRNPITGFLRNSDGAFCGISHWAAKGRSYLGFGLRQIVFSDDSRLDGYPLHRVRNGIIVSKFQHFAFDYGAVFIPYSSFKMITELRRDSGTNLIYSRDFRSIIQTAS